MINLKVCEQDSNRYSQQSADARRGPSETLREARCIRIDTLSILNLKNPTGSLFLSPRR